MATATYALATLWDGAVAFVVGLIVDRGAGVRTYRRALVSGAAPLGVTFVLAFLPPPGAGPFGIAVLLGAHMLFRTAYTAVNLPYLAMSARLCVDSADRALVAGMRMIAGVLAAVVVAAGTVPLGAWFGTGARAFQGSAMLFAAMATVIIVLVGATFRDQAGDLRVPVPSVRVGIATLARNRAFVTLAGAITLATIAVTILTKSVLYYFKYRLGNVEAGQLTLASMMATSAIAIPLWIAVARRTGARNVWFAATALGLALLGAFTAVDLVRVAGMQAFLVAVQVMVVGIGFAGWALLPDTIEYGQRGGGARVEGMTYGVAALLQRVAIAGATAIFGTALSHAGFIANSTPSDATQGALRLTVAVIPAALLALAALVMWRNPLRRGEHARVVAALERDAVNPPRA